MLNKLLKLAKPSSGDDCCGVEIVEEVDETTDQTAQARDEDVR